MSYRIEGRDIVIAGFEKGIADSPYAGIADMRNVNTGSMPGEAAVNFSTQAITLPPAVSALAFTAVITTNIFTVASTTGWFAGMAITLNTWSGTGPSTGVVYYVGNLTATTFQIFTNPLFAVNSSSPVVVTGNGSGTLTSYTMAKPLDRCFDNGEFLTSNTSGVTSISSYIIDTKNQVWVILPPTASILNWTPNVAIFCGNIGSTITSYASSICVWQGYLFLFRNGATDLWQISNQAAPASRWTYGWAGLTLSGSNPRKCLVGQDDTIYVCNASSVASIFQNVNKVFSPTDATTYTGNTTALALPQGEIATCLTELGVYLLVGGIKTFVYPWDRTSTSYLYPIIVPERYVSNIVGTQTNAFIFAGNRGNIYITNSVNINLFKKIPDYISGVVSPYYLTGGSGSVSATTANGIIRNGDAFYARDQLYFTVIAQTNDGTTLTSVTGIWAIDLETEALRMVNRMSYGSYGGTVPILMANMTTYVVGGDGLLAGWVDGNGNIGIDATISTPYTNYETYIETDMIPIGTYINPFTPTQIEWKTATKLVSGESVRISYRKNLTDTYTLITDASRPTGEMNVVGSLSDMIQVNFEKAQWIQLKVETKSTASSPSYVRLTEIRIREAK